MKKIIGALGMLSIVTLLALLPVSYTPGGVAFAQISNPVIIAVSATPSGSCTAIFPLKLKTPDGTLWSCQNGTYGQIGGSSGVTTIGNSDGTLTIAPTSGTVTASLNLGQANTWTASQTAPAFIPQNTTAGPSQYFFDDFYNVINLSTGTIGAVSGNSCAITTATANVNHPGQILLTSGTGGTGTGESCFVGNNGAGDFNLNTASNFIKESDVLVPVLPGTTAGAYQFGVANTNNASPWTTGFGFLLSSANAVANDWYCQINSTYTDTGVAAVASTWTRLTLVSDGTNLHYYINGTQVCGTGTAISGIHTGNMQAGAWTAVALSGTSVTMAVDYLTAYRAVTR